MTSQPMRTIQIVLLTATCLCMAGVIIVFLVALKYRKNKVMKAASPGLLYVNLFGCLVLYSQSIISTMRPSLVLCMMIPCFRLIGFYLTYGPLCFKTWRVAVIMQVVKSRAFSVKDSALYKILCAIVCICVLYLLLWGSVDPVPMASSIEGTGRAAVSQCSFTWWAFVAVIGEVMMLIWGIVQCVRSRKAPNLYNDTKVTALILYNEIMWILFDSTVRYMLLLYPSDLLPMLLCFVRTQLTVTLLVAIIFGSKFYRIKCCLRELHGTVTDIYGDRKVHRLALIVNKYGDIKNIYCAPCGPLNYTESSINSSSEKEVTKDTGYTEVEIDRLVNLLSKLKSEKEMYRLQVLQLQRVLRGQMSNGALARMAQPRLSNGYSVRPHMDLDCDNEPDIYLEHKDIVNRQKFLEKERNAQRMDISAMREDIAYKTGYASTVTTYISSRSDRLTPLSASGSDGVSPEKRKRGSVTEVQHNSSNYAKSVFATTINSDNIPVRDNEGINACDRTMWPLVNLRQIGTIPAASANDDVDVTSSQKHAQNNAKMHDPSSKCLNSPTGICGPVNHKIKKKKRSCDVEFEYIRTNDSDEMEEFPVLVTTARQTQAINLSPRKRISNGSVPNCVRRESPTTRPEEASGTASPNDSEFVVDSDKMFIMYI